ncbi:MAG: hypothetical protein WBP93_08890 [Pyrinomonadaceae bacterium]
MTKDEAREYEMRWRIVNSFLAEEARHLSISDKLRQLALMYEAGQMLGWDSALKEGEAEVRERWRFLRERCHV